jgi:ABC-2 type transport system permease protein
MSAPAGTGILARLVLRRDRVRLAVWIVVIGATVLGTAASFASLYPTVASRVSFARSVTGNAGLRALIGRPFDLTSIGGLTAWRIGSIAAVLVALMSALTVVRHTRAEEEQGRRELVGAGAVGRHAPLTAALAVVLAADLAVALVVALSLVAMGEAAAGALALGLALAGAGAMFAAVAALAAQVTETARAANGIVASVLGLSYVLRAAGDAAGNTGPSWLSWLSPIGWAQRVRPFAGERWWVLGLIAAFALATGAAGYALAARRDLGAGLLPSRPGRAQAGTHLRSPLALAWRLQRGSLAGWAAGFAVLGAAVGGVADSVSQLVRDSPQLDDVISRLGGAGGVVDAYLASIMSLAGMLAAAYAVQAALRLRSEEMSLRAEPVLATAVGRIQWTLSHAAFAVLGPAVVLAAAGLSAGVVHGLRSGDLATQVGRLLEGALVQLPATWVVAGIALALFGLAPQLSVGGWAAVVACLLLGQIGPLLRLPQAILDISPFAHVPKIPGDQLAATPLVVLVAVAAALTAAGLAGVRRRDIA